MWGLQYTHLHPTLWEDFLDVAVQMPQSKQRAAAVKVAQSIIKQLKDSAEVRFSPHIQALPLEMT